MFGFLNKALIAAVAVLATGSYILYLQYDKAQAEIATLNSAIDAQRATTEEYKTQLEIQTQALKDLSDKSNKLEGDVRRYLDIFKRHDLTKLATAKPGLIEPRINKATKEVFDAIEDDSRSISGTDD